MFATSLAMMAFAICTQFQVMRKSMSCTAAMAMCAASVAALRGMIPEARISRCEHPDVGRDIEQREVLNDFHPFTRRHRVAGACLIDDKL